MPQPVILFVRSLTNIQPDERQVVIYERAAEETGFPCWVERFPAPKGANQIPETGEIADLWRHLDELRRYYGLPARDRRSRPAQCPGMWSLWTEWGDADHSPFWRRVEELEKEIAP